ncbi:MAG TPA: DUF6471 domain-containing protein [Burkholderiaceae bacterium]|nr:DUF6471 domain-containing protein [Burkholderiaceae bacterium]
MRDFWEKKAKELVRAEMARQSISYKGLSERLEKIGVHESEKQLMNKVARGKFAFSFFLQCMSVMEVPHVYDLPRMQDIDAD